MKQFYETNTVTYNLMSFTGFKSIYIFTLLLDGPMSYKDLQESLLSHEYLHEKVSIDTLRIYLNSLRKIGCNIKRCSVGGVTKYYIAEHPFKLNFDEKQIKSIIKIYKAISKTIDVADLISLQQFIDRISERIDNPELIDRLQKVSPFNGVDFQIIKDLMLFARNNTEITVNYKSATGNKNITILVDKLSINNRRLYVSGFNSEYKNYASFLVSKIDKVTGINLNNKTLEVPYIVVGYEYTKSRGEIFELADYEKITRTLGNKLVIEMTSKNKFEMMQRILYHSNKCKVLYPEDFKMYILNNLQKMKEGYLDKE